MPPKRDTEHWTLDKRVPVALIIMFVGQLVGFGWLASKFDSRVTQLENDRTSTNSVVAEVVKSQNITNVSLAVIQKDQSYVVESLKEIKRQLSKTEN